jgi:hypothetical protein
MKIHYLAKPGTSFPAVGHADLVCTDEKQDAYSTDVKEVAEHERDRMAARFPYYDWSDVEFEQFPSEIRFLVVGKEGPWSA